MRDELADHEWPPSGRPMLEAARPSTGEPPLRSQWHLRVSRSGAPWRDLPDSFGPYTACYNRSFDGGGLAFEAGSFIGPKMPNRLRWGHRVKRTLPSS